MFVILTNIPTPYRTAFFDVLAETCVKNRINFKVLYCAESEPNRHWPFEPENMNHPFEVLDGFHPSVKRISFHLNLTVKKRLNELKPKVLICAGSWNMPSNWLALKAVNDINCKTFFWSEGHIDAVRHKEGLIAKARRKVLSYFDGFAIPNERSKSWLEQDLNKSIKSIRLPNTVDENFYQFNDRVSKAELLKNLNISTDQKIFLQVSQLEHRKGVIELAESFLSIPESIRNNALLVFLGTGGLTDEVNALVKISNGTIKSLGHVSGTDVKNWLRVADWFVLNTFLDPNPLTPIEASFTRTPLILSKKAGNSLELCNEKSGILIKNPSDPKSSLLLALNTLESERETMGNEAYFNVVNNFTRHSVAKNLLVDLEYYL